MESPEIGVAENWKVFAVIPAAGSGERVGSHCPKQFQEIAGYPLILHTLWSFQRSWICETVVAVSTDWFAFLQNLVSLYKLPNVHLLLGGETRHQSIRRCVQYVRERVSMKRCSPDDTVVIVHDAVRPFVAEGTLQKVTAAANEQGAAGVVSPLVSTTLARRPDGILDHSLVRSKYCNSLTPQAFSYATIVTAYDKISQHDLDYGTEVLHLALEYAGVRARLIDTNDQVWKITYRRDVFAADQFAKERLARAVIVSDQTDKRLGFLEEEMQLSRVTLVQKSTSLTSFPSHVTALILVTDITAPSDCIPDLMLAMERLRESLSPQKGIVVLLVSMPTEERDARDHLMSRLQELAVDEHYDGIYVNCVIIERQGQQDETKRLVNACKLTVRLVLQCDEIMSGQTLIV